MMTTSRRQVFTHWAEFSQCGACLCSRSVEWSRTAELVSLKRLDRGNTERELDRLIKAQTAALGPCRVERVVPQRFSGLGDRRVELFLLPRTEERADALD